jgi:hypothetical protein
LPPSLTAEVFAALAGALEAAAGALEACEAGALEATEDFGGYK